MDQETTMAIKEEVIEVAVEPDLMGSTVDQETTMSIKEEEIIEVAIEPDSLVAAMDYETIMLIKKEETEETSDETDSMVVTSSGYVPYSPRLIQNCSESIYISSEETVKQVVVPSELEIGAHESKLLTMFGMHTQQLTEEEDSLFGTRLKCSLREKEFDEFSCSYCLQRFPSKYRLTMHVFIHIDGVQPPTYVCKSCGEVFPSNISLNKHLKVNGSASPDVTKEQQAEIRVRPPVAMVHRKRSTRDRVVALIEGGECSMREAGRRYGVPHTTTMRWWKKYLERGSTCRARGSGRKRVSSEQEDRELLSKSRENPFLNAKQLRRETNFRGSSHTIRRRLKDAGLHTRRSAVK